LSDTPRRIIATEEMLHAVNEAHKALEPLDWVDDMKHLQCTLDALAPFLNAAPQVPAVPSMEGKSEQFGATQPAVAAPYEPKRRRWR
jgi:hypothetical protein